MRRPDIGLLWSGLMLSALGDRLHQMALMWIAVGALGGSGGLVAVAGNVAHLLFGLPAGVFADRWDRRATMIAADLLRALAVATLAAAALSGPVNLWHLGAVGAVLGTLGSFFQPALQASLPALAGDPQTLQRANALMNINYRLALIVGPSLAGFLLAFMPITQFFTIDMATFVASAGAIAMIGRRVAWTPRADAARPSLRTEVAQGAALAWRDPVLLWAAAMLVTVNVSYGVAWIVGLPLLARDVFGGGPETYGYLMAAYGVGNVASNLVVGSLSVRRQTCMLFLGGVVYGAGIVAMGLAPSFAAAVTAAALAAVGGPMTDLMLLLLIQTRIPEPHIGKVLGLRFTLSQTSLGLGLLAAAPLYARLPLRGAIVLVGSVALACALAALAWLYGQGSGSRGEG